MIIQINYVILNNKKKLSYHIKNYVIYNNIRGIYNEQIINYKNVL